MSAARAVARHRFEVARPIDEVFALFDPIAEKQWVEGWDPEPVHPVELSLEPGSVFFLDRGERREIWTVLRHDPATHVAEYLATSPDHQQRWITVACAEAEGGTGVEVEYRVTALSAEGARELATFDNAFICGWEPPVRKALGL